MKPDRPHRTHPKGRTAACVLCCLLTLFPVLTACADTPDTAGVDAPGIVGPEVHTADAVWMEPYTDPDLGETLRYRELRDTERFVARADRPVLLVRYDVLDGTAPTLIPALETLAMDTHARGYVLLIDTGADDPYAGLLDDRSLPAYDLIDGGTVTQSADAAEPEAVARLLDRFAAGR